jgi:phage virion morphogenesis protein
VRRIEHPRPAFAAIGEVMTESIQENFERGGRPTRWKPLSQATIARRKLMGQWPGKMLVNTRMLMQSIVPQATDRSVVITANDRKAATHHFGAARGEYGTVVAKIKAYDRKLKSGTVVKVRPHTRNTVVPWGNIPARPFMMVQSRDWPEMVATLRDYVLAVKGR